MDLPALKGWIEDLCANVKKLENENVALKQQNESLSLENQALKDEIGTPKETPITEETSTMNSEGIDDDETHEKKLVYEALRGLIQYEAASTSSGNSRTLKLSTYMLRLSSEAMLERLRQDKKDQEILDNLPSPNPLEIPEVVRIMMGFVQIRDLAPCRVVCKLWRHEATKQIQNKHQFKLNFFNTEKVKEFLDHAAESFPTFRNLFVNMKGSDGPPNSFSTLFIRHGTTLHDVHVQFGYDQNLSMDNFRDLLLASLGEIRTLKIEGLRCTLIHGARIFNHNQTMKILPNLTLLNIEMIHPCILNHQDSEVFIDLLRIAPNLTTLHWRSKPHNDLDNNGTRTMLESLVEVNPAKFEKLFLYSPISTPLLALVATCHLKLTQLYFSDLQGLEVLFATPTNSGTGTRTKITPKRIWYNRVSALGLKLHLERRLAECGEVYCTALLNTFLSAMAARLAAG